uniref:Uncharacterized protein n=1 Tax=Anguilla anguilla TaxID=7936 RepID=A0A0E9TBU4_ANGAN
MCVVLLDYRCYWNGINLMLSPLSDSSIMF